MNGTYSVFIVKHASKAGLYFAIMGLWASVSWANEPGFLEAFSLSSDRTAPLQQLIPGTEEYYYYHSLQDQNQGKSDRVEKWLDPWIKKYGYTPKAKEILNRQALLNYTKNPEKSIRYFKETLNLRFQHQKEVIGQQTHHPNHLDNKRISRSSLQAKAFQRYKGLQGFEDSAVDFLAEADLTPGRRRELLRRLQRPDIPGLASLVVADLRHKNSQGFGDYRIHRQLLRSQLDECVRAMPALLNNTTFIETYLKKLWPSEDVDWEQDPLARTYYYERLWQFVQDLPPAQNSLKAHVLYHWLSHDRAQGMHDPERFMTYLRLPRNVAYINATYNRRKEHRHHRANLNQNYRYATLLPRIGNDEPLVRSYLQHFFIEDNDYKAYAPYIRENYLKEVFAETKIVHGLGDGETWAAMLPAEKYQQLKERVDLEFSPTNKTIYDSQESVVLDLYVKNVNKLIVKVFKINTANVYRQSSNGLGLDVNVEGLLANEEHVFHYQETPFRRKLRRFELPTLKERGAYVIEFIGNGKSSRALIRKGRIQFIETISTAGHRFTLFDDQNQKIQDGRLWLEGHHYTADSEGKILVPFTNQPQNQRIVVSQGDFAEVGYFQHQAENYLLSAGIYVDREALLKKKKASVLVRPFLYLNETPVTLSVLENVTLVLESTTHDGVRTTQEKADFQLFEDRVGHYEFLVPPNLMQLRVTLKAKVQNLSQNQKNNLSDTTTLFLNGIDQTEQIEDLHFLHIENEYVIDALGKSGEPKPHRPVTLQFKHRDFRNAVSVVLQTNTNGRIALGPLLNIEWVTAQITGGKQHRWYPVSGQRNYPPAIHHPAETPLWIPYMGPVETGGIFSGEGVTRRDTALLGKRGDTYATDHFDAIEWQHGFLKIENLPPGEYELFLKRDNRTIAIRVAKASSFENMLLAGHRLLHFNKNLPLQIDTIDVESKHITIQLRNTTKFTRVLVVASRFMPAYSLFGMLDKAVLPPLHVRLFSKARSLYHSERRIGDEYRYILERKYIKKFPGNMLNRPSLLLNPMSLGKTDTDTQQAGLGEILAERAQADMQKARSAAPIPPPVPSQRSFANLDFMDKPAVVLSNLQPNADGQVVLDRKQLGGHQQIHILAMDPENTVFREMALPETPADFQDLRLTRALDPEKHYSQQKKISVVKPGETFVLEDITTSDFEIYDHLAAVYSLYATLRPDSKWSEFQFLPHWPTLSPEAQKKAYSKFASHELHFFLFHKDRPFFDKVLASYLKHKKDKTFLDQWLLNKRLTGYRNIWAYSQLNLVEKILLGHRLPQEKAATSRYVREWFETTPPNIEHLNFLFTTALNRSALASEDSLGFVAAQTAANKQVLSEMEKRQPRGRGLAKSLKPMPKQRLKMLAKPSIAADMVMEEQAYFDEDEQLRNQARPFYQKLDKTEEWVENNYYLLPQTQQNAQLIPINAFWNDYARTSTPKQGFLSTHFAEASHNFTEMMLAFSVLDLPFQAKAHDIQYEGSRMTLQAKSPMLVVHQEIREAPVDLKSLPILVNQHYYKHNDRYRYVDNERQDKPVTGEFLTHTVYGVQIVLTNPTSSVQKLDILWQIPQGAIPVLQGGYTRSQHWKLEPYATKTLDYHFYFPKPGQFPHYPVHVAKDEKIIAYHPPQVVEVVAQANQVDLQSWEHLSQQGAEEDVLRFLQEHNLNRIDLNRIAFRMRNAQFFKKVIALLKARHVYHDTLWSYSVYHNHTESLREYLEHSPLLTQSGSYLQSPLVSIDPIVRQLYQHKEYYPLVNARAHPLGKSRQILNQRVYQQYRQLLRLLSYKSSLEPPDFLAIVHYLLLQDRVEEALSFFRRIDPDAVKGNIQYDYLQTYLAMYQEEYSQAKTIAIRYQKYPVLRWRNAFVEVLNQLQEIEGHALQVSNPNDRTLAQTGLASTEPSFDLYLEAKTLRVIHQNISQCKVHYYLMDVELLFSRNPFVKQHSEQFSTIQPHETQTLHLTANQHQTSVPLPEPFHNRNLMVEVVCDGIKKSHAYYSHALGVQLTENYGQLKVVHQKTGKALSKVYVKVYARRHDGNVFFYKDGYTDGRGRFDYTSLNTNELDSVQTLSLLILSEAHGAVIREASPPKR